MTITSFCLFHRPCKRGHVCARGICWTYRLKYSDNHIMKPLRVRSKWSFFFELFICCKILSFCWIMLNSRDCKDVGPNRRLPADVAVPPSPCAVGATRWRKRVCGFCWTCWWKRRSDTGREAPLADVCLIFAEVKVKNFFWGLPVPLLCCRSSAPWASQVCCTNHNTAKISGKEKEESGIW